MKMKGAKCSVCGTRKSKGGWLLCLGGWTLCSKCSKDWSDFDIQVDKRDNIVILMETYFRRGKGQNITFEQMHKKKSGVKFLTWKDLIKEKK